LRYGFGAIEETAVPTTQTPTPTPTKATMPMPMLPQPFKNLVQNERSLGEN